MESFTCCKHWDFTLKKMTYTLFFLMVSIGLFAQTTTEIFELPTNCKAKDLEPVSATLTGLPPCIDCDEKDSWPANLTLQIDNTTGSTRTSFAFWAVLETTTSEGISEVYIYGCNGPVNPGINNLEFGDGLNELKFYDQNGNVLPNMELTYECGSTLKLTDMVMGWTPASSGGGNDCPLSGNDIESKCKSLDEIIINTPVTGVVEDSVNVSCFDGTDGSIDITPSGGVPPYSYMWSKVEDPGFSSTDEDLINISAGTYSVKITDSTTPTNCSFTLDNIVVEEPAEVTIVTSSTNVSCNGDGDGSLSIDSYSGTGDPSFYLRINDGAYAAITEAALEAGSYGPGTYMIKVTYPDGNGEGVCEAVETEVITESDIVTIVTSSTNVSCNGDGDGSLSIDSYSGTGDPSFYLKINDGAYAAITEAALEAGSYGPGTYMIKVTYPDGNGEGVCEVVETEVITESDIVTIVTSSTNVSCNGDGNGSLSIDSYSGTGDPSFYLKINDGAYAAITEAALEAGSYGPGTYMIKVTYPDGNGEGVCEAVETEVITESDIVTIVTSSTNVSCNGDGNGSLSIDSYSGTGDPSFYLKINDGAYAAITEAALEAGSYGPGTYMIKVTYPDGNGEGVCEAVETEVITEAGDVSITTSSTNVSCNGEGDGSLSIDSYSGTGDPSFYLKINDGAYAAITEAALEAGSYGPGTYMIKVTYPDGNGEGVCEAVETEVITEAGDVSITTSSTNVSCNGEGDGSLSIDSYSGTGDPSFYLKINDGAYAAITEAALEAGSYGPGTYMIKVTYPDGNGEGVCEVVETEVITESDIVTIVTSSTNVSCNGDGNGSLSIDSYSGTGDPSFYLKINDGAYAAITEAALEAGSYGPGTYMIKVTYPDGNGEGVCEVVETEVITESDIVTIVTSSTNVSCNGDGNGSLSIDSYSGTGDPSFYLKINDGAYAAITEAALEAGSYGPGTYMIKVTYPDGNGEGVCEAVETEVITESDIVTIVTSSTNVSCNGDGNGSLSIDSYSGTGDPSFYLKINDGAYAAITEAALEAGSYGPGTYMIKVTYPDGNGEGVCEAVETEVITEAGDVSITTSSTNVSCNGDGNGSLSIDSYSGTGDPSFYLKINDGAYAAITEAALEAGSYGPGTYMIKVTYPDGNGEGVCEAVETEVITEPLLVEIPEIQTSQATCIADAQGSVAFSYDPPREFYYSYKNSSDDIFSGYLLYTGQIALSPGTYDFKVKYTLNGCESDAFPVVILQLPDTPLAINPEVIQPDCETGFGSIQIRIGIDTDIDTDFLNYTVSSGGTIYYDGVKQPAGGFTNLPPGDYIIFGLSDDECSSGRVEVTLMEPDCDDFTGCTLGYWKNHTNQWCDAYQTCTSYVEAFFDYEDGYYDAPEELRDLTLQEVLNLGGGGVFNFGRQSVAALLNACSGEVDYELPEVTDVIGYVRDNVNNAGAAGSYLDMLNNAGCTMGGSRATTAPSDDCESYEKPKGNGKNKNAKATSDVSVFPVPFKETVNLSYDFDYTSDVTIEMFDMRGRHLRTYKDKKVTKGSVTKMDIDFALKANQSYILKVTTDREKFVKQIVSSKKK